MYWLEWYFLGAAFCFDVLLSSKIEGMCHSFWKFHCYVHVKPTIWFWFTVQVHMAMIETLTNKLQKSLDYGFQGDGNTKWPKVEGLLVLTFSNYLLPFIESTRYWWRTLRAKSMLWGWKMMVFMRLTFGGCFLLMHFCHPWCAIDCKCSTYEALSSTLPY